MHIALIEDEEKLAASLKEGLESEGYGVDLFTDGETAEHLLSRAGVRYAAIILDLMLPGKNGFEVCASLRAQSLSTPILVLTARSAVEDKVRALDSGADDFMTKPFSFEELIARVRAQIRRAQGFTGQKMTIGTLAITFNTHEVTRAGIPIALTPTEFGLLCLLVEHADRVLSREEISSKLWNVEDGTLTNIVDVHISNLRKKIDDEHPQKVIRTVRGAGYTIQK